jgi:hypothetical protein
MNPKCKSFRGISLENEWKRTFAFLRTLQDGPIQEIKMNFSRTDSLSLEYFMRA